MSKSSPKPSGRALGFPTCQFCGEHGPLPGPGGRFIQYGVRHYAHAICCLMAGRSIADLAPNQREAFTPDMAKEFVSRILRRHGLDLEGGAP